MMHTLDYTTGKWTRLLGPADTTFSKSIKNRDLLAIQPELILKTIGNRSACSMPKEHTFPHPCLPLPSFWSGYVKIPSGIRMRDKQLRMREIERKCHPVSIPVFYRCLHEGFTSILTVGGRGMHHFISIRNIDFKSASGVSFRGHNDLMKIVSVLQ